MSSKQIVLLFLFGLCLTTAVRIDWPETIDERMAVYSAASALGHGDFDIPLRDTYHPNLYVASPAGRYYPKFGPGQTVLMIPFVAIGKLFIRRDDSPAVQGQMIFQASLFFGSLAVTVIGILACQLWITIGYSPRLSMVSAIILLTTSELLPFSRSLFTDLTCALLSLAAFYSIRKIETGAIRWAVVAGVCMGLSVLVRPVTVLFLAPFIFYFALIWKRRPASSCVMNRQMIAALLPILASGCLLLLYNRHAYGSFFSTGYQSEMFLFDQSAPAGLSHLLVSSEKGFFLYSPAVLLSLLFWNNFHRAHREESLFVLLFSALYLYVYATWYASSAGMDLSYGQRFLLPVVPLAYLALPECLAAIRREFAKIGCGLFVTCSFAIQIVGCLQKYKPYSAWASQYEIIPSPPAGYFLMSFQDPSTIAIWWWRMGGIAIIAGVGLVVLSVIFGSYAIRQTGWAK